VGDSGGGRHLQHKEKKRGGEAHGESVPCRVGRRLTEEGVDGGIRANFGVPAVLQSPVVDRWLGGGKEGSVALTCRVKWGPGGEKRQKRLSGFFVYPRRGEEGGGSRAGGTT
jgi:hypothetical protein